MPDLSRPAADAPPAVAHVVLSLDVGGLERVVLDLVRLARAAGRRAAVVCLERRGDLAGQAADLGAAVVALGKPPGRRPELVGQLRAVFGDLRPDVVHTHQIGALYYAGPAARAAGIGAVVHTEHGDHVGRCRTRWGKLKAHCLRAVAGRQAARFCCVSPAIAARVAEFGAVPRRKLAVVPNGIDTTRADGPAAPTRAEARRALGLPPDAPVVGTMGRLVEVKRQDALLRGFAALLPRHPDARLVLVGDGPERPALAGLAEALGLGDRVLFAGYRAGPERLLPALDAFALTSRSEGMPLSILEAWAAGVPVVASRVGGIPALIAHDRTGLLFDAGDEATLAAHLDGLLADPARARRLGAAGRARAVADFDSTVMAAAYLGHYRDILGRRRPAAGP